MSESLQTCTLQFPSGSRKLDRLPDNAVAGIAMRGEPRDKGHWTWLARV